MQFLLDLEPEQIILVPIDVNAEKALAKEILNQWWEIHNNFSPPQDQDQSKSFSPKFASSKKDSTFASDNDSLKI